MRHTQSPKSTTRPKKKNGTSSNHDPSGGQIQPQTILFCCIGPGIVESRQNELSIQHLTESTLANPRWRLPPGRLSLRKDIPLGKPDRHGRNLTEKKRQGMPDSKATPQATTDLLHKNEGKQCFFLHCVGALGAQT